MDFVAQLGLLAIGSRLRRLSDKFMKSATLVYRQSELPFEPSWFPLFRYLSEHDEGLTVGEAARALGLSHAAISQTASKMCARNLIEIHKDDDDERRRLLSLSTEGRAMLPALRMLWMDLEKCIADAMEYSGCDLLAAIEGMESALAVSSINDRVADEICTRNLAAVEIIDFEERYADDFRRLNFEWLEKHFKVEPIDEEVLSNAGALVERGGTILFARVDDHIVGTCALEVEGDTCELIKMAVTEGHRGRRIGAKLLEASIERARALGFKHLHLVTNSKLQPAVNLYRKFGFRVVKAGAVSKYERGDLYMEMPI